MVTLVVKPAKGTPEDASTLARADLITLKGGIDKALSGGTLDAITRAHLDESRARIEAALHEATTRPGKDLIQGAHGVGEGMAAEYADQMLPKFWPENGLLVARAGGNAGLFSAIIGGWLGGRNREVVQPVTQEIAT